MINGLLAALSCVFTLISIGIILFYFVEKSDNKEAQEQYLKNTSSGKTVYLPLNKIKEFYYLYPEKYQFKNDCCGFCRLDSRGYHIYTQDLKEQAEFKKWMQQIEEDERESKRNSSMVEFLEKVVKADIRHVKRLADEQFQQARKTAEEASERLKNEEI